MLRFDRRADFAQEVGHRLRFDGQHDQVCAGNDAQVVRESQRTGFTREGVAGGGDRIAGAHLLDGDQPGLDPSLRQGGGHLACAEKPDRFAHVSPLAASRSHDDGLAMR